MILDDIIARKRITVAEQKRACSLSDVERSARQAPAARDFFRAIQGGTKPAVIAEIKKASPSAGVICADLNIGATVASYEKGGAAALSVITEEHFFQGKLAYLRQARKATRLPLLCKDFIIDPLQIFVARAAGADAVLLIAACLGQDSLVDLFEAAGSLGMACLVEVHDEEELARVLETDAAIVGINNRNLKTFDVTIDTTLRLRPQVPEGRLVVSESGIRTRNEVETLAGAGVHAILVGTSLMRSGDPEKKLRELQGTE
jgi:indole-3-glycerol phosphate synthase